MAAWSAILLRELQTDWLPVDWVPELEWLDILTLDTSSWIAGIFAHLSNDDQSKARSNN